MRRQIVISIHAPPRGATRGRSRSAPPRHFNSRPSARGDAGINTPDDITKLFQFTPLREGRHTECHTMAQADFISIHAPPRGATNTISRLSRHRHFNSRPSARGDTDSARVTGKALVFQFTPLREGRPQNEICLRPVTGFQFTPLREGRPLHATLIGTNRFISIHAPPRGATSAIIGINPPLYDFNSRPSARGDGTKILDCYKTEIISIHAPPRGATTLPEVPVQPYCISIHAPPRGATALSAKRMLMSKFQFTPLREGRLFLRALR